MTKQLIVIGGGAAGFFCAVNAARMNPSLRVILLEKTSKLLAKVKVSGGGRCNVTHNCFDIADMSKRYPRGQHFVKKSFHQFFTKDTIAWFEERGVKIKAEKDGRMFPVSDSSQSIIDCLLREADKYGVLVMTHTEVKNIKRDTDNDVAGSKFILEISNGNILIADFVCIACGGYPKVSMFDWLKQTGHTIEVPVPSLFTFNIPNSSVTTLMGVSVPDAIVKIAGTKLAERGPLLITHWGLSGPVVLKLSAWGARELAELNYHFTIKVNWIGEHNEPALRELLSHQRRDSASQKIGNKNPFSLPQRLWNYLLEQSEINEEMRWADLPSIKLNKLVKHLGESEFAVKGKATFKEEFVTAGGIRLNEIDPASMMSKKISNLFFAGEIIDVDGVTGGFNFQHAWTSGYIAAKTIATASSL